MEVGGPRHRSGEAGGILKATLTMIERRRKWLNAFGDGRATDRIVRVLEENPS
jgi:hypothetical protein